MVNFKRWLIAQDYERAFWSRVADRIVSGASKQLSWYGWKASEMEKRLVDYFDDGRRKSAKVLEIGSGPVGIISFISYGERYAIDPLETFYRSNAVLTSLRDPAVGYGQGTGEQLPFKDSFFSLVILDNVLDHVQEATSVLNEIYRVLSIEGLIYLVINVHTEWGAFLHSGLSKIKIDKGHPHTFTVKSIREFISRHRFDILREEINDYCQAREKDRRSSSLKDKIKGYSGLSEFIYYGVYSKQSL